ncbi:MAG: hypothetical protein A2V70_00440 [Planctomycetes bacterium RBG_13_63_9]|nr:MAG: hypothetical protein A2V70_00440 [Planctomycetes bacterium RBG_13_63_9]
MPSVSKCPKCQQAVTIPDGVDREVEVRCPLCAVVYPLGEAMAELPPALVPVDGDGIVGPAAASEALLKSNLVSEPYHISEPYHVPGAGDAGNAVESAGTEGESAGAGAESPTDRQPVINVWQQVDSAPRIDTAAAGVGTPSEQPDTFGIVGEAPSDGGFEPLEMGLGGKRRRSKGKGLLRLMVEVIGGGFLGLTIGYYLLCWLGPSSLDLPKLPLPLLPHTMEKAVDPGNTDLDHSNAQPKGSVNVRSAALAAVLKATDGGLLDCTTEAD